jgi:hypothetical protein
MLGPGFASTFGLSTGMGTAIVGGAGGGAIGSGVSYSGQSLAAEARGEGSGYSAEGLAYSMGLGAGYGALMGLAFQAIFGSAPSPTVKQAAKEAAPDAPLLAPDPPQQAGAPRLSEPKTIGGTPSAPQVLQEADAWGKAPCISNAGGCGGRGTPQPITTPKPTSLPNSDQGSASGSGFARSMGSAGSPTDADIAIHAKGHYPKLNHQQLVEKIAHTRNTGTTVVAPNGNKLTYVKDGTLLIEDMSSFEGGTIFRYSGNVQKYIGNWLGDNQ